MIILKCELQRFIQFLQYKMTLKVILVTTLLLGCFCSEDEPDYYWREYFGKVPRDAVVAGKDIDNTNVYIGQAYVKDSGLIVTPIKPGVKEVYATYAGIKKLDKYTKILCGPQKNFYWMKSNYKDLHTDVLDKHAVLGGHEDSNGYMNIGRFVHSGELKVGKVSSFWLESAYLYFNDNGTEKKIGSYEVLLYKNDNTGVIDVRVGVSEE